MEFLTITAKSEGNRYVAIYRKWFSETLGAWELELVPGTLRWLTAGEQTKSDPSSQLPAVLQNDGLGLEIGPTSTNEPQITGLTPVPVPSAA
jgi:hypothetical protein